MLSRAKRICGSPRLFPVTDSVMINDILSKVAEREGFGSSIRYISARDVGRIDASKSLIALNVSGRQCYLAVTTYHGRPASFLVHVQQREVCLVPLIFSRTVHELDVVFKCTLSTTQEILVLNDVCDTHKSLSERMALVHRVVHEEHVPDRILFPLRIVCRRCVGFDQADLVKDAVKRGDVRYHSVSVLTDGSSAEFRALVDNCPRDVFSMSARCRAPDGVTRTVASVIRAPGPDAYKICIDGLTWSFLSVRTMAESQYLARMDLKLPKKLPVHLDGENWRLDMEGAFTPERSIPVQGTV
jgi:hypothetical protein